MRKLSYFFFNFYKVKLAFIINCRTDGEGAPSVCYVLVMGILHADLESVGLLCKLSWRLGGVEHARLQGL